MGPPTKSCKKCGAVKLLSEFHRAAGMRDGHRSECKACHTAARKKRYAKNPKAEIRRVQEWRDANYDRYIANQRAYKAENRDRIRKQNRDRHLSKKYGIVSYEFDLLVLAQLNLCAICFRYFGKRLHVDHDHRTGRIRGLLCGKCNKAIGLLDDEPRLAHAAEMYLARTARS